MCACVGVCVDAWWRLAVDVEVLCNWFKVDAISAVPLKVGWEEERKKGDRKEERESK